jgi:hypothetical protein
MFGYVLPEKPELKIKEYELFRAYYCGVCKSIGQKWGQLPRVVLNYDCTFLALLLSAIYEDNMSVKKQRCIAHPVKKHSYIEKNKFIDYASDINILLAYYNLKDNWVDDKQIISGAGMAILGKAYKKIYKKYTAKCEQIEKHLLFLAQLEKDNCKSMDQAAEPFARLMETIMDFEPSGEKNNSIAALKWLGYNLGKWIYIIDAYDDLEEDIKKGSYNPLARQFELSSKPDAQQQIDISKRVEFNLTYTLSAIAKCVDLLNLKHSRGIIENIVYMGMLRKTEKILGIGSCSKIEKSI